MLFTVIISTVVPVDTSVPLILTGYLLLNSLSPVKVTVILLSLSGYAVPETCAVTVGGVSSGLSPPASSALTTVTPADLLSAGYATTGIPTQARILPSQPIRLPVIHLSTIWIHALVHGA